MQFLKLAILVLGLSSTASAECDCSGSSGDPHLRLAHGGSTDFKGRDGALFNFVSSQNMSMNVKTEDATFRLGELTVHGSFLTGGRLRRLKPRFSLVRVASLVYMWKGVGQRVRKV